jgi:hypothetical protein
MKKIYNRKTADDIASIADSGGDVSKYFTKKGRMKYPIHRVNVDFTSEMLKKLDDIALEVNVSRQAVIKVYLQQSIDRHNLAKSGCKS